MAGETTITVIGNVTADPELRYTQGGKPVVNGTIASTPRIFDRQANEWRDGETLFLRYVAWRNAEGIAGEIRKGRRVIAVGTLKQKSYDNRDGHKVTYVELEVDSLGVVVIDPPRQRQQQPQRAPGEEQWAQPGPAPAADAQWNVTPPGSGAPSGGQQRVDEPWGAQPTYNDETPF